MHVTKSNQNRSILVYAQTLKVRQKILLVETENYFVYMEGQTCSDSIALDLTKLTGKHILSQRPIPAQNVLQTLTDTFLH